MIFCGQWRIAISPLKNNLFVYKMHLKKIKNFKQKGWNSQLTYLSGINTFYSVEKCVVALDLLTGMREFSRVKRTLLVMRCFLQIYNTNLRLWAIDLSRRLYVACGTASQFQHWAWASPKRLNRKHWCHADYEKFNQSQ